VNDLASAALPRLLTVKQAAETLNVSRRLVYKLVQGGSLRAMRVASAIRVPESAVWAYLERSTQAPPPPAPPATRATAPSQPLAFHL
jgi:excisionase family DNA binding protein